MLSSNKSLDTLHSLGKPVFPVDAVGTSTFSTSCCSVSPLSSLHWVASRFNLWKLVISSSPTLVLDVSYNSYNRVV